ncbi:MAG: hypothetical protein HC817_02575 [Saprospiraceae bacterium]|nr:hypothetical protein [Saprospiraceae bacterium]
MGGEFTAFPLLQTPQLGLVSLDFKDQIFNYRTLDLSYLLSLIKKGRSDLSMTLGGSLTQTERIYSPLTYNGTFTGGLIPDRPMVWLLPRTLVF